MNLSFNTSPKMLLCIAAVILAVLLFCAFKVNTDPGGIAFAVVIFASMALAVLALFTKIDVVIEVLRSELEPKPGCVTQGHVSAQRTCRDELTQSLVHALAPYLANNKTAAQMGTFIREVSDSILGASPCPDQPITRAASTGAQADQAAEAEIVGQGLTAPRVTAEQIQALMEKLIWVYDQPEGTTSTFAHAYLGRFYLATGHSACVSPENFNAALGVKYAREQGEGKMRDKLWELEGYKLHSAIAGQ